MLTILNLGDFYLRQKIVDFLLFFYCFLWTKSVFVFLLCSLGRILAFLKRSTKFAFDVCLVIAQQKNQLKFVLANHIDILIHWNIEPNFYLSWFLTSYIIFSQRWHSMALQCLTILAARPNCANVIVTQTQVVKKSIFMRIWANLSIFSPLSWWRPWPRSCCSGSGRSSRSRTSTARLKSVIEN